MEVKLKAENCCVNGYEFKNIDELKLFLEKIESYKEFRYFEIEFNIFEYIKEPYDVSSLIFTINKTKKTEYAKVKAILIDENEIELKANSLKKLFYLIDEVEYGGNTLIAELIKDEEKSVN